MQSPEALQAADPLDTDKTWGAAATRLSQNALTPKVGLVVPSWGYRHFLPEQMQGILSQTGDVGFVAVLVDDCDPDPEIVELCETYAAAYPDLIHYIRPRHNGGLSAVRNQGAEYILQHWPEVEVVMFPDADDRMTSGFVANSYRVFKEAQAETLAKGEKLGWVFEHPNIFGMAGRMMRLTRHSVLWNMVGATQMPTSALSADMFKSGLRYNENMKTGGEDWNFSIGALREGYVARHCSHQGFLWRRRPGSMSNMAAGGLASENNRTVIRIAHSPLFAADKVIEQYQKEVSHFAVVGPDGVRMVTSAAQIPDALRQNGDTAPDRSLALTIQKNHVMSADPCPQTIFFANNAFPPALQSSGWMGYFTLVSDFYAAAGQIVHHRFIYDETIQVASLANVQRVSSLLADVAVLSVDSLKLACRDGVAAATAKNGVLEFIWNIPGKPPDVAAPSVDTGLLADWVEAQGDLISQGMQAKRHLVQGWRPKGLDWRRLPTFHININRILICPENRQTHAILCEQDSIGQVLDWLERFDLAPIALLVSGKVHSDDLIRIKESVAAGRISDFYLMDRLVDQGPSKNFWRNDLFAMLMVTFNSVHYWSTLQFADVLGALRACDVHREIVFPDTETAQRVLGTRSSVFKAFDQYRILDPATRSEAVLNAFGIPSELIALSPHEFLK